MSANKILISREIKNKRQLLVGTVLSIMRLRASAPTETVTGPAWMTDVDIGSNNILKNVPVMASAGGSRSYAQLGQSVTLQRNAFGRWDIVGPADLVEGVQNIRFINLNTGAETSTSDQGFTVQVEPFHYLMGDVRLLSAPLIQFVDAGATGTITRTDSGTGGGVGSFVTEGFADADVIRVQGPPSKTVSPNDGTYTIDTAGVTATVLTVVTPSFTAEGPRADIAIGIDAAGRFIDAGSTPLLTRRIFDNSTTPPSVVLPGS